MSSGFIHRPLIPMAVAVMVGIAAGAWTPGHPTAAAVLAAVALAAVVRAVATGRPACVAPLVLLVGLGYLSIQPWLAPRLGTTHAARFVGKGPVPLFGSVMDVPRVGSGRQQFQLDLNAGGRHGFSGPREGKIRVTVEGLEPAIARGDTLSFETRLRDPRNFNNPGGFDYRRYLFLQGVRATAFVPADRVRRVAGSPGSGPATVLERFRQRVAVLLFQSLRRKEAAVLSALTIGDQSRIDEPLRTAFHRVGVGHLLAISGLHVAVVAALVYGLARRFLAWLPFLLVGGRLRKAAALATAGAVWTYAVVAGLSPSTQRAALMISAYLAAMLIDRERDLPNTLGLAALVVVAVHPPSLFSISFQLSFLAVAWMVAGFYPQPIPAADGAWIRRRVLWLWNWTRQFFFVSLWAILGTLPIVMQTFNQVSLVGLPTNFLFVPYIGTLVVCTALTGTALAAVCAPAAVFCFKAAGALLAPALSLLEALARWPASAAATFTPRWEEIALFYAAMALCLGWRKGAAYPRWRRWRTGLCALLSLAILGDGLYWGYRRFWHPDLRATVLDVGQGSATVVELPGGAVALVDGGGFSDNTVFDVGRHVVAPFLRYQKIGAVDLVVLSHANADHLNGLIYVMDTFPVAAVWSNHEAADTLGYRRFVETIQRRRLIWPAFQDLPRRADFGGGRIELLYPPAEFIPAAERCHDNANNHSLVLRVSTRSGAVLLPGDIEASAEGKIVAGQAAALSAVVLVVPHHGSRTSSSAALLAAVRPKQAIVSCGWHNRYGMPHPSVLQRLDAMGARIWRTDHHGAVSVWIRSDGVRIEPFVAGPQGR